MPRVVPIDGQHEMQKDRYESIVLLVLEWWSGVLVFLVIGLESGWKWSSSRKVEWNCVHGGNE